MHPGRILESPIAGCPCRGLLESSPGLDNIPNNRSATIGAQLAGNHTYSVLIKLHDPNHWVKPPLSLGCWHTLMKLSLSSLLLVFLADKLNQACATPSSLRCCTWSVATCTVEQFPVKRQDPKSWCQERSVSLSNRIFEAWSKILRISHAMVSARYSARSMSRFF